MPPPGGADDDGGTAGDALALQPVEGCESGAVRAEVDVEDIWSWRSGGDGDVPGGCCLPPGCDAVGVGGGVQESVAGRRRFLAGPAREHGPADAGVRQGRPK